MTVQLQTISSRSQLRISPRLGTKTAHTAHSISSSVTSTTQMRIQLCLSPLGHYPSIHPLIGTSRDWSVISTCTTTSIRRRAHRSFALRDLIQMFPSTYASKWPQMLSVRRSTLLHFQWDSADHTSCSLLDRALLAALL